MQQIHKRKSFALICRAMISFLMVVVCLLHVLPVKAIATTSAKPEEGAASANDLMLTEDYYALPEFSTHMPILVLEISESTIAEEADGFFMNVGVQTFAGEEQNTLHGQPVFSDTVKLRNMTDHTNESAAKNDYFLSLETQASLIDPGRSRDAGSREYLLLGAKDDKSLIRNYIGYALAAGMFEDAPTAELCEVFLRSESGELYQGVYTLVEFPAHEDSVLFHRGQGDDGISIETYSTQVAPENGKISLPFMETTQWDDRYGDIIGEFSTSESILYSTSSRAFYSTPNYFEINDFSNQFILGEIMENYAGAYDIYYCYNTKTKMISVLPVWNFEHALDNLPDKPAVEGQLEYDKAPYFDQMFKSPQFASMIQERYLELRRGPLSENALMRTIDEGASYVAPAVGRDWARWDLYRNHLLEPLTEVESEIDEDEMVPVIPVIRTATTYDDEMTRLRYNLREHNLRTAVNITQFNFSEQEVHKEIVLTSNPLWPILFLIGFFLLVRFVRRYGV